MVLEIMVETQQLLVKLQVVVLEEKHLEVLEMVEVLVVVIVVQLVHQQVLLYTLHLMVTQIMVVKI